MNVDHQTPSKMQQEIILIRNLHFCRRGKWLGGETVTYSRSQLRLQSDLEQLFFETEVMPHRGSTIFVYVDLNGKGN